MLLCTCEVWKSQPHVSSREVSTAKQAKRFSPARVQAGILNPQVQIRLNYNSLRPSVVDNKWVQ
jgi:hypothetical protein